MSYTEKFNAYVKEHGIGSDTFKFKEGKNRLRLLTEPTPHDSTYTNPKTNVTTRTLKWVCYLLDRQDGRVQLAFLPTTIARQIASLQQDEDYRFDEFPMPYDITINAVNAGTKEVRYSLIPSPKPTPITSEEMDALNKKNSIDQVLKSLKEKQSSTSPRSTEPPMEEEINVEDISF